MDEEKAMARELQVPVEISELHSNIDRLQSIQQLVSERLKRATRDEPKLGGEEADRTALVPLAEDVRNANDRIKSICDEFDSVLSRLEL